MQLTPSIAIMQVTSVPIMQVILSFTAMLVDLSVAIIQVTISIVIMQLEVSATTIQGAVSTAILWVQQQCSNFSYKVVGNLIAEAEA